MTRLHQQLRHLYAATAPESPATGNGNGNDTGEALPMVSSQGDVRALVLTLARPAEWAAVARLWQGVQADLALPAPAIAVSGQDAYQLWFSLVHPVPAAQAVEFLQGLVSRYWAGIQPSRLGSWPAHDAALSPPWAHAPAVPAQRAGAPGWSAFVSADLAPMFADDPWLDMPPNPDGQASLLAGLRSITQDGFEQALLQLAPASPTSAEASPVSAAEPAAAPSPGAAPAGGARPVASSLGALPSGQAAMQDNLSAPRRFLLGVMRDERIDLALRIQAAQALLPYESPLP